MIYIINQHKGEFSELKAHLLNYVSRRKSKQFNMMLRIDCPITDEESDWISDFWLEHQGEFYLSSSPEESGWGLSKCRKECTQLWRRDYPKPGDNKDKIIFGCTNSEWKVDLTDSLAKELHEIKVPCLIECEYKNDPYERTVYKRDSYIDFETYINDDNRPDYTLMIPACYWDHIQYIPGEKYYPEEIILLEILQRMLVPRLFIYRSQLQLAWYNPKGMSMSFDRKFMIANKKGFYLRARKLIDSYLGKDPLCFRILLTPEKLKAYVYDLATFGTSEMVLNEYKGTIIEPLYWWAVQKWVNDEHYNHKIQFIEDEEQY